MNNDIKWYITRFFNEFRNRGAKKAIHKVYRFCMHKVLLHINLPAPKSRRISLLHAISIFPFKARYKARVLIGNYLEKSYSLDGAYIIPYGSKNNFFNDQVVLLAHWDPENIVDPYVLHMASHLKQLGKKVILCSAAPLTAMPQYADCLDAIICRTCQGYDFTSWKAAFEAFPSLYEAQEITLCNDSVFAPIGSYISMYHTMSTIVCDFWGMTFSYEVMPHMQSFHIVLRKKALQHPAFKKFIEAIKANGNRENAVGYEVRFSLWLELNGLRAGCYRPYNLYTKMSANPTIRWKTCLRHGIPLLKRELFKSQGRIVPLPAWREEVEKYHYPAQLICNYFYRIGIDISPVLCLGKRSATWPPSVLSHYMPLQAPPPSRKILQGKLKIAAIIHCYYPELFPVLLGYLKHLPKDSHIYISTDTEDKRIIIQKQIDILSFSKKEIRIFPNKGWDIAPFLVGFNDIIPHYDLICKVHTKASSHMPQEKSLYWRTMLYEALLGSKTHIQKIINNFENSQNLGMIAPPSLPYCYVNIGMNHNLFEYLLHRLNLQIPSNEAIDFPVGSMFWARSKALQPLLNLNLSFDNFMITNSLQRDGTLAHAIERIFFFSCCKSGYYWGRINPSLKSCCISPTKRSI